MPSMLVWGRWITRACKVAGPAELVDSGFSQKLRLKAEEQLRNDNASKFRGYTFMVLSHARMIWLIYVIFVSY